MDKEYKALFVTLGVAFLIILITKPKGFGVKLKDFSSDSLDKYSEPKKVDSSKVIARENAAIGMQAMKDAIAEKESKQQLDKLNSQIQKKYGIKIVANKKTGKLRALSVSDGSVVAEEA